MVAFGKALGTIAIIIGAFASVLAILSYFGVQGPGDLVKEIIAAIDDWVWGNIDDIIDYVKERLEEED